MASQIPTVVCLEDGEEFTYYVEIRIYFNPENGEWRLATKPKEFEEDAFFVRQVLSQCALRYVETFDEARIATRKEMDMVKAAVVGTCPSCGGRNGLGLTPVQKVGQEIFGKKRP